MYCTIECASTELVNELALVLNCHFWNETDRYIKGAQKFGIECYLAYKDT